MTNSGIEDFPTCSMCSHFMKLHTNDKNGNFSCRYIVRVSDDGIIKEECGCNHVAK